MRAYYITQWESQFIGCLEFEWLQVLVQIEWKQFIYIQLEQVSCII